MSSSDELRGAIRHIPDFPKKGILFADVTTLLQDMKASRLMYDKMAEPFINSGVAVVVGGEARGFIFGTPVAERLGASFVPIRKPGKLPHKTISVTYKKEYGTDELQMHVDAIRKGQKVLIVDDLLATGGTARAMVELVEKAGGIVAGICFAVELGYLNGRKLLSGYNLHSVLNYKTEAEQK